MAIRDSFAIVSPLINNRRAKSQYQPVRLRQPGSGAFDGLLNLIFQRSVVRASKIGMQMIIIKNTLVFYISMWSGKMMINAEIQKIEY